jgi:hypothetical protein
MTRALLTPLVLLVMMSVVGCGSKPGANRPKTYPVTGTVTLGDKPVEGATLNFQLSGGSGSSVGTTDATGNYKLSTFGGDDGARLGDYKVAIVKYDRPAVPAAQAGKLAPGGLDANYQPEAPGAAAPAPPKNLLPERYANAETSGLTATVREAGPNKIDFPLQP